MSQLKLRYTLNARNDLNEIYKYISARDVNAAKSVINAVEHSLILLTSHPLSARQTDVKGVRVKAIPTTPYLIFFTVSEKYLNVIRVAHSAQQKSGTQNI